MQIKLKLLSLSTLIFTLFICQVGFTHDGHDKQDMLIPNLGDLGKVDFPVSCSKDAKKAMNTGVGLLHHMMYAQAEEVFVMWIDKEPECAMMHWGYSMTLFHPLWPDTIKNEASVKGELAIKVALTHNVTKREKHYINAAAQFYKNWKTTPDKLRINAWANAQKVVFQKYPNDIDAVAFYALSKIATASMLDRTFSQHKDAGTLLEKFRKIYPTHPGVIHYTIHAFDSPLLAELAVDAARAYDKIAPDVPHALHMPSHIFVRLGMWNDVINWNIRSAKAALKYPVKGVTSQTYVHASDYLIYGYLQLNNVTEALKVAEKMEAHYPIVSTFAAAYALAAIPARLTLEQKHWQQASQLTTRQPDFISWEKYPQIEAITYFAKGLGAARNGNLTTAKESMKILNDLYDKTLVISPNYWAKQVDAQRQAISAWISYEIGNKEKALVLLRQAADLEDSMDKSPITPGAVLPARELLADMLLLNGDDSSAMMEYKASLVINPKRFNSLSGINYTYKKTKN